MYVQSTFHGLLPRLSVPPWSLSVFFHMPKDYFGRQPHGTRTYITQFTLKDTVPNDWRARMMEHAVLPYRMVGHWSLPGSRLRSNFEQ